MRSLLRDVASFRTGAMVIFPMVGVAAIAISMQLDSAASLAFLSLVQFSGGLAVLAGVWLHRPRWPGGWLLLASVGLLFGTGVAVWWWYGAILGQPFDYPGWPDVFFVPAYLALAFGLAMLIRRRAPSLEIPAALDALIVAVGFAFANWMFLTGPAVAGGKLTTGQQIITLAYPFIDVVIVALVAHLLLAGRRASRSPALWLLAASTVALLGGDTAYAFLAGSESYRAGALPDQLWMLALVLLGTAALHPSMRAVDEASEIAKGAATPMRLGFLIVGLQVPLIALAVKVATGGQPDAVAMILLGALFAPLLVARVAVLVQGLRRLAMTDELTGLANRTALVARIGSLARGQALEPHRRRDAGSSFEQPTLLFIDIDNFKKVNDTLGHHAGDAVLVMAAARLRAQVREGDFVARLGGDEFVVLCATTAADVGVGHLAGRIVETLARPFTVDGQTLYLGASVGAVEVAGNDAVTLLRNADAAMYAAKAAGRGRWVAFQPELIDELRAKMALSTELHDALESQQGFVLHYQPVIDLRSGRMVGAEALVRWQHPTRGLLAPGEFIPLAEQDDSIIKLGAWVLGEACQQAARWQAMRPGAAPLTMAVNASARQLAADAGFENTVAKALGAAGLDPAVLVIEVTETALFDNPDAAAVVLRALQARGMAVAIDDFGTGYASLTYLRRLPVNAVKIDRSFVNGLGAGLEDTTIVAAVIGLAKAMGLKVIAEGVETAEQLLLLRDMFCHEAQGYYLARPVPAAELSARLDAEWFAPGPELAAAPRAAAAANDAALLLRAVPSAPPPQRFRVVIADDDPSARALERRELEATGRFEVVGEAEDGEMAERLSAIHQPHLVVLDMVMPGVDGLTALPRILLASPGTKVVLVSGHASPGGVDRALAIGAHAFFKKGVANLADELLRVVAAEPRG